MPLQSQVSFVTDSEINHFRTKCSQHLLFIASFCLEVWIHFIVEFMTFCWHLWRTHCLEFVNGSFKGNIGETERQGGLHIMGFSKRIDYKILSWTEESSKQVTCLHTSDLKHEISSLFVTRPSLPLSHTAGLWCDLNN